MSIRPLHIFCGWMVSLLLNFGCCCRGLSFDPPPRRLPQLIFTSCSTGGLCSIDDRYSFVSTFNPPNPWFISPSSRKFSSHCFLKPSRNSAKSCVCTERWHNKPSTKVAVASLFIVRSILEDAHVLLFLEREPGARPIVAGSRDPAQLERSEEGGAVACGCDRKVLNACGETWNGEHFPTSTNNHINLDLV
eukprot:01012_3